MTLRCGKHLTDEARKYQLPPSKYMLKKYENGVNKEREQRLLEMGEKDSDIELENDDLEELKKENDIDQ